MTGWEQMLGGLRKQLVENWVRDLVIYGKYKREMNIIVCEQDRSYLGYTVPNA